MAALYTQTRVSPPELSATWPYAPTGKIFARNANGQGYICSGSVIAPRIVLTAAHCVFDNEIGAFATEFIFVPAYALGTAPAGVWTPTGGLIPSSYTNILDVVHPEDFAVLVMGDLNANAQTLRIGDVVGWYGVALSDISSHLFHIDFLGYPANLDAGEVMQRTGAQTLGTIEPNNAIYGSDQGGGSSGGPYVIDLQITADGGTPRYPVVVAAESFGDGQGLVGVSLLNDTFRSMLEAVCASAAGNC